MKQSTQKVVNLNRFWNIDVSSLTDSEQQSVLAIATQLLAIPPGTAMTSPESVKAYLRTKYAHFEHEVFVVMYLDQRNRLIHHEELFRGTLDGASVYPREVVKQVLVHNAAAVIFAHNHPSGYIQPSQADISITRRLKDALALIDVRVLDHLVVGREGTASLAELGHL